MLEGPHSYSLFAPGTAAAPKVCRDFVRSALTASAMGHLAETAAFCASELATNVHQHAKSDIHLRLAVAPTHVRIGVYDGDPTRPTPRRAGETDTSGRGLFLVTALTDAYGVCDNGSGKGVWFELRSGRRA